ncbi:DUF7301 family protein [Ewingella docleensis]|uniref:DUF7301 family protein n=1 Tax=Ewingella docleensis TaxID=3118588 RepID=UPI003F5CA66C
MMRTTAQLLSSALTEGYHRRLRFRQASSLPYIEKMKLQPVGKPYRRDRVLRRIIQMNLDAAVARIGGRQ